MKKFAFPLLLVLTWGCNSGSQGLFYSIENEQRISSGTLPQGVTVYDMAEDSSNYYLAAYSFYYQKNKTGNWATLDISSLTGGRSRVLSIVKAGANMILAVSASDFTNTAVFYTSDVVNGPYTQIAVTGSLITNSLVPIQRTTACYIVTKVASSADSSQAAYNVYYTTDGTSVTALTYATITELAHPPIQAVWDGTYNYVLTEAQLVDINNVNPTTGNLTTISLPNTEPLGGITYDSTSAKAYIVTQKGNLFYGTGSSWAQSSTTSFKLNSTDSYPVTFGKMIVYTGGHTSQANVLALSRLSGGNSQGTGYFEIVPDGGGYKPQVPSNTVDTNNYLSTTASPTQFYYATLTFPYVASDGTLFIGSAGSSLWIHNNSDQHWSQD